MFGKKCRRCNRRISRKFEFCPFCGNNARGRNDEEEYGILGKDDNVNDVFGSISAGGGIWDKMLGNAMKMLEKEMSSIHNAQKKPAYTPKQKMKLQLYINGRKINLPQFEDEFGKGFENLPEEPTKKKLRRNLPVPSEETIRAAANLPRKEAKTKITRLSNKIIYEIEAAGADSIDKVLINKLEDGFEVRIFTKNMVLTKNIALKLPLVAYYLEQQKLFLEFRGR